MHPVSEDATISPRAADRLARAVRAAQALSETLWEALHEELARPRRARVAELSERLADVSATVALLSRVDVSGDVAAPTPTLSQPPIQPAPVEPMDRQPETPGRRESPEAPPAGSSPVVLVDERAPVAPLSPEIEIKDARVQEAHRERPLAPEQKKRPDPWVAAIARRLEGYQRDRAPFAVLALELADIERLRHAELPGEMARLTGLVESALADQLGPADSLTRATPGRYWLLAAQADAEGARVLAERLTRAVRGAVSHRGAPLELAVGVAACPADATRAGALAAHAEIALYAARAAGRPIAP
jgi:GGDEF domain-containing protein